MAGQLVFNYIGTYELGMEKWLLNDYDVDTALARGILVKPNVQLFGGHDLFLHRWHFELNGETFEGAVVRKISGSYANRISSYELDRSNQNGQSVPDAVKAILDSYGDEFLTEEAREKRAVEEATS